MKFEQLFKLISEKWMTEVNHFSHQFSKNMINSFKKLTAKFWFKSVFCFALIALADYLFYKKVLGWTAGLFVFVLASAVALFHVEAVTKLKGKGVFLLLIGLSAALMKDVNPIAYNLAIFGLIILLLNKPHFNLQNDLLIFWNRIYRFVLLLPGRLPKDVFQVLKLTGRGKKSVQFSQLMLLLFFPVILSGIFISLLAIANPIILSWLSKAVSSWDISFSSFGQAIEHTFYWLSIALITWAFLRPKILKVRDKINYSLHFDDSWSEPKNVFFNTKSLIISLSIFNLIFLVQTVLDLIYLWGGKALPSEFTYAEYAHRGAYPLIFTALIAGLFVMLVLKPNTERASNRLVRGLVYFWILQNILLVVSSIWRTGLYIETYMLTRMRVVALIWMFLVAIGLVFLLARVYLNKSNRWLVNVNAMSLLSVLYLSSFVNFNSFIADYNLKNCREFGGKGYYFDFYYVSNLGVAALPALAEFERKYPAKSKEFYFYRNSKTELQRKLADSLKDWRSWTMDRASLAQKYL